MIRLSAFSDEAAKDLDGQIRGAEAQRHTLYGA